MTGRCVRIARYSRDTRCPPVASGSARVASSNPPAAPAKSSELDTDDLSGHSCEIGAVARLLAERLSRKEEHMDSFTGKLAVVTGGGSGMGRELVRQLAAQGCSVGTCDLNPDAVTETAAMARTGASPAHGVRVTSHACDVSDEAQVLRFRDEVLEGHATDHVDLVFNNAGIGGGGSFIRHRREDWERTFAIDWWGVYYCGRAFLPLLIASGEGVLVNTSSVN